MVFCIKLYRRIRIITMLQSVGTDFMSNKQGSKIDQRLMVHSYVYWCIAELDLSRMVGENMNQIFGSTQEAKGIVFKLV